MLSSRSNEMTVVTVLTQPQPQLEEAPVRICNIGAILMMYVMVTLAVSYYSLDLQPTLADLTIFSLIAGLVNVAYQAWAEQRDIGEAGVEPPSVIRDSAVAWGIAAVLLLFLLTLGQRVHPLAPLERPSAGAPFVHSPTKDAALWKIG